MKFLIAGLGNTGSEYWGTRHNVGFRVVNAVAEEGGVAFTEVRYGAVARVRVKNAELILLKPNTFMNLSGLAVRYWLQKENLTVEHLLAVADDIALPFGSLRLKPKGSAAGHNGLRNIEEILGTQHYGRLRFGIGNNYPPGKQVDYVLGQFEPKELEQISAHVKKASEMVKSFCLSGADVTMNLYN